MTDEEERLAIERVRNALVGFSPLQKQVCVQQALDELGVNLLVVLDPTTGDLKTEKE